MSRNILPRLNAFLHKLLKHSVLVNLIYMLYRYLFVSWILKHKVVSAETVLKPERKSKLVVLGGGASVNNLSSDFFDKLEDYDVIALSYAVLLPVKVDYFLYEIPRSKELSQEHNEILYPRLADKNKKGGIGSFFVKNPNTKLGKLRRAFPLILPSITFPIHVQSEKKLAYMIRFFKKTGLSRKYFFQSRGSLFSSVFWGDSIGYKEILLVGIDLNTVEYFYEDKNKWFDFSIPNPFYDKNIVNKGVHPTNDEDLGMKIEDAMRVLKENIEAKVFVTNPNSALAPDFEFKSTP